MGKDWFVQDNNHVEENTKYEQCFYRSSWVEEVIWNTEAKTEKQL